MTARTLVLGSVGRERVHCLEIESPVVFGGTAFYATEAILKTSITAPVLVSVLGSDLTPETLIEQFSRAIPMSGLTQNHDLPSFYWEGRYETSLDESLTIALENRLIDEFHPDWRALRSQFPDVRFCYLAAFDPSTHMGCCQDFGDAFILSETLEYWISRNKAGVLSVVSGSNGVVITEREFRALWQVEVSPRMPFERVAQIVEHYDLDFLIVTFADRGSQVFESASTFFVPAVSCNTVDPTGAGNAYSGGIISHLSQSASHDRWRLLDAVTLGTALAALQVQDFGNHALLKATAVDILSLQREVRGKVDWFG